VFCHTRNCGLCRAFTEPNGDREGAATQEITAAEGGRFLTGAVRVTLRNMCDATLVRAAVERCFSAQRCRKPTATQEPKTF